MVTWMYDDGGDLPENVVAEGDNSEILVVKLAKKSNEGFYECKGSTGNKIFFSQVYLEINGKLCLCALLKQSITCSYNDLRGSYGIV